MPQRPMRWFVLIAALAPLPASAGPSKPCVSATEATQMLNKDICISAHVYDVVQLADGTRFLDVCAPEVTDEKCAFTVESLKEDRDEVGELRKYRDMDVQIRGIVRPMHGRAGMVSAVYFAGRFS